VQQVADELKQYGLSLQNYASIREQQIGGFTQVGGIRQSLAWCAALCFVLCVMALRS
jgi:FAD/FMN-containing dehydrogenase